MVDGFLRLAPTFKFLHLDHATICMAVTSFRLPTASKIKLRSDMVGEKRRNIFAADLLAEQCAECVICCDPGIKQAKRFGQQTFQKKNSRLLSKIVHHLHLQKGSLASARVCSWQTSDLLGMVDGL